MSFESLEQKIKCAHISGTKYVDEPLVPVVLALLAQLLTSGDGWLSRRFFRRFFKATRKTLLPAV